MSIHSNNNNPIITRDNYEEYFLMYVDDELTPQERSMVEAFVQFNPELQTELDMLMGTKLEPEGLSFGNLDNLFAASMSNNLVDESLLLHVDNELDETEKKKVEQRLQHDTTYNQQFQWLLRTKSDPSEVIPCPNKEALYKHSVRRIGFAPALRIAAAVLLIASMGLVWWMQDSPETAAPAVAVNSPKTVKPTTNQSAPAKEVPSESNSVASQNSAVEPKPAPEMQLAQVATPVKKQADRSIAQKEVVEEKESAIAVENDNLIAYSEPVNPATRNNSQPIQGQVTAEKELATPVTSRNADSYNTTNTVAQPSFASVNDEGDRGNKNNLKSLLRKATRLVERRAGIDATNEDDELIIGAVAIKLK